MDFSDRPARLLDAIEVAKWLGLAPSTVYLKAASNEIPCVRLWRGRRKTVLRFRREDIEGWLHDRASVHGRYQ